MIRTIGLVALLGGAAGIAEPQELVVGEGGLKCGGLAFVTRDPAPGPPQTVSQGSQVDVLSAPADVLCPGPATATFTAELSGPPSAVAVVTLVARCVSLVAPTPAAATLACAPDQTFTLAPEGYRIPLVLGVGPEARTVAAAAVLPPGPYTVSVLVAALGGNVVVEKATLVVVTGGRPPSAWRPAVLAPAGARP